MGDIETGRTIERIHQQVESLTQAVGELWKVVEFNVKEKKLEEPKGEN